MVIRNERRVLLVFDAKEAKMLRMDCILQTNVKEEVEPSLGTSDSCQYEIESREEAQFMQEVKDEFEIKVEDEFLGFSDEPFFPNQQESPDKQDTIRTREEGQFMQEVKEEFEIKVEDEVMGLPDEPFFPNQQESTGKQDTIRTSGSAVMASQGMREVEMSLVEAVRDHPTLQDSQNEKHKLRRHHKSQFISVGESMNSLDPQLGMFTAGGGPATNDLSKIAKVIGTRNSCVLGIEGRIDTNQDKPIQERDPPTLQSNSPDVITVGPTAEEEPSVVTAQPTMVAQQVGDLQPPAADQQAADLQQPALLRNVSNAPVKCLSVQDAIDLLYSEEFNVDDDAEVIDLVNIPPDDDLSDEDEVDDDNPLIPMVKDVPGAIEIHTTQIWRRNEEKKTSQLC
ncbi:uncharacterized protein LOC123518147 isoform X2 [Portunus trituberculatus]|uniref:uncharacterized protein LOC123518147 isoform X2 n=1 Tax=Portunus trituberculatus TaxID=210409 RepID=UPI001E1CC877|nr:uncharacterized protein LOC123518147 isoform X2 [Portunus trituberculatus]